MDEVKTEFFVEMLGEYLSAFKNEIAENIKLFIKPLSCNINKMLSNKDDFESNK